MTAFRMSLLIFVLTASHPAAATSCGDREPLLREAKLKTWPKLYRKQDHKGLSEFLAAEFTSVDADGILTTRAQEVAWLAANPWPPHDFTYTISRIDCPSPDIGIVVGQGKSSRRDAAGEPIAHVYQSSNLFLWQNGRWRAAMSHVSGSRTETAVLSESTELLALERRWNRAIVERDGDTVENILSDDFVFVSPNGALADKAAVINATRDKEYVIEPFETIEPQVRVHGTSAVITGRFERRGTFRGQPFAHRFAYTDVYVKKDGRWRAVSAQASTWQSRPAK